MTGLPLKVRLRRAMLIALLLGLWAPVKIMWEQDLSQEQSSLRYQGMTMTRQMRDDLGQGLTIGVLSGMRSVVSDIIWLYVTDAWQHQEWFRMGGYINLCTSLQPRCTMFWVIGGWHLAWNASIGASEDIHQTNELKKLKATRFWIDKGLEVYLRGIENNPEYWRLWADTGLLYQQRIKDYYRAAYYYEEATKRPNCPIYYERFPAIMYGLAGDDWKAYEAWKTLWFRLTPAEKEDRLHWKEKIESNIRQLESKLSIPKEKRVFPN